MKFRIWDKKKKDWARAENFVMESDGSFSGIVDYDYSGYGISPLDLEKYIFSFSTGFKDKEDRDIYDGDIIEAEISWWNNKKEEWQSRGVHMGEIYLSWTNQHYVFSMEETEGKYDDICDLDNCLKYTRKIIGNIYESGAHEKRYE